MLGRNYRFSVLNATSAAVEIAVVIQARKWRYTSAGAVEWASEAEEFSAANIAVSSNAWTEGTAIDNSSGAYIGADLEIEITPEASITGSIFVQIQRSTDGGTTWPSDGGGEIIAQYYFSASASAVVLSVSI